MPEKGRSAETEEGLKRWLEGIGLGHHSDLFLRHRIDFDVMSDLTETDLSELGLPLGSQAFAARDGFPRQCPVDRDRSRYCRQTAEGSRRR